MSDNTILYRMLAMEEIRILELYYTEEDISDMIENKHRASMAGWYKILMITMKSMVDKIEDSGNNENY